MVYHSLQPSRAIAEILYLARYTISAIIIAVISMIQLVQVE